MEEQEQRETLFEKHRENIYFRWGLTIFTVIVASIVVAQLVTKLTSLVGIFKSLARTLAPLLYGLGIAYLLDPIAGRVQKRLQPWLQKRLRHPERSAALARGTGVLAALALLVLIAWALLAMVLPQLLDSITTIIGNLPAYYSTITGWLSGLIDDNIELADLTGEIVEKVYAFLSQWLTSTLLPKVQSAVVNLTSSVVGMAKALLNLIIGIIISVYLLMGKRKFLAQAKKLCYGVLGLKKGGYVCNVCTFANQAFGGFIGGKLLDSLIIGVLCFLGLSVLDMPYTMLISVIVGVTNIIPFFGPYLGAIPSGLLLLVIDPWKCLSFIIFILVLQQIDGNIIGPMILGDATGLDSIWVVVSILVFGSLYGVVGMIIAVPTFAVIYKIITEIVNHLLQKRGLSTAAGDYTDWNYPPRMESEHWRRPTSRRRVRRRAKADPGGPEPASPPEDGPGDGPEPASPPEDGPGDGPEP